MRGEREIAPMEKTTSLFISVLFFFCLITILSARLESETSGNISEQCDEIKGILIDVL